MAAYTWAHISFGRFKGVTGLNINVLVYWSIVQFIQNFTGQNASCTGQVQEQLRYKLCHADEAYQGHNSCPWLLILGLTFHLVDLKG